jgi:hypothetical protein
VRARLKRLFALGLEVLVAACISFGFFALFLLNLAIVFPSGLSLRTLMAPVPEDTRGEPTAGASAVAPSPTVERTPIAKLEILRGIVRSKPADAIAWGPALEGQRLMDRDGVQTDPEGRARLDFGSGGEVILEPNSLIVLTQAPRGAGGRGTRDAVLVLDGEIWGRFGTETTRPPRIALGRAVVEPTQGLRADAAEFRAQVRKEGGSTVSVLKGSLALTSGTGLVHIGAGEFGVVSATGKVIPAKLLPPTPRPVRPAGNERFSFRRMRPPIEFRWLDVPRATRYRLVVIRVGGERTVVVNERLAWPALTVERLGHGQYQWRVSSYYGEVEGFPSAWRTLTVVDRGRPRDAAPVAPPGRVPRRLTAAAAGKPATGDAGGPR